MRHTMHAAEDRIKWLLDLMSHPGRILEYLVLDDPKRHRIEISPFVNQPSDPKLPSSEPTMLANAYASNPRHGFRPFKPVMWVSRLDS